MKKFAVAAICTVALVGYVLADEFTCTITSLENGVSGTKKKKGAMKGDPPEEFKLKAAKDLKVFKGKFDVDAKKLVPDGDADKDVLKSALLLSVDGKLPDKGQKATIITNDKDEITTIIVGGGGKKGVGKKGAAKKGG